LSWRALPPTVQGVTIDPRNDNVVFLATSVGVLRSTNAQGGELGTETPTWQNVLSVPMGAWSITIVGGDSPVLYATTKFRGVYRSLDAGTTWTAINAGITDLQMGRSAPVIVDPEHSEVLYVGSEGGGGVFRSGDGGESWTPVNLALTDTSVFGLAADPRRPGILYVSGPHGIFATTTGGKRTDRRSTRERSILYLPIGRPSLGLPSIGRGGTSEESALIIAHSANSGERSSTR
jgi:hypothetical protein